MSISQSFSLSILSYLWGSFINTLRPRHDGRHFPNDIFKCIFLNKNVYISIEISLTFVPRGSSQQHFIIGSDNGLAPGRHQAIIWTNDGYLTDACMRQLASLSVLYHDDVIEWKHFPPYWPFVRGIHRFPVNSPHKGQWGGALMFTLICARINGWVNNRDTGDLRRHRGHYDVTVVTNRISWEIDCVDIPFLAIRTFFTGTLAFTILACANFVAFTLWKYGLEEPLMFIECDNLLKNR